jgi:hypothetical protein
LGSVRRQLPHAALVAADEPQLRPVLLCLKDRRLPLARQILEAGGLEQRLVELTSLLGAISESGR